MLTKADAPHLLLRVAANVACVVIWAAVIGVILLTLAGCMTGSEYLVKINPATGEGTATLTKAALVEPVSGSKVMESEVVEPEDGGGWGGLLWSGIALATGIAFPRTRRNLGGIVSAIADVDLKRAGKHVASLTPFFGSPTEALPPAQKHIVMTANPARTDP